MSETLVRVKDLVSRGFVRPSSHGYTELDDDGILYIEAPAGLSEAVVVEDVAMERRLHEAQGKMTRRTTKLVHEGKYLAQVPVDLIEEEGGWSPYLSHEDAVKLDQVRLALRDGDIATATRYGKVYELLPLSA